MMQMCNFRCMCSCLFLYPVPNQFHWIFFLFILAIFYLRHTCQKFFEGKYLFHSQTIFFQFLNIVLDENVIPSYTFIKNRHEVTVFLIVPITFIKSASSVLNQKENNYEDDFSALLAAINYYEKHFCVFLIYEHSSCLIYDV